MGSISRTTVTPLRPAPCPWSLPHTNSLIRTKPSSAQHWRSLRNVPHTKHAPSLPSAPASHPAVRPVCAAPSRWLPVPFLLSHSKQDFAPGGLSQTDPPIARGCRMQGVSFSRWLLTPLHPHARPECSRSRASRLRGAPLANRSPASPDTTHVAWTIAASCFTVVPKCVERFHAMAVRNRQLLCTKTLSHCELEPGLHLLCFENSSSLGETSHQLHRAAPYPDAKAKLWKPE